MPVLPFWGSPTPRFYVTLDGLRRFLATHIKAIRYISRSTRKHHTLGRKNIARSQVCRSFCHAMTANVHGKMNQQQTSEVAGASHKLKGPHRADSARMDVGNDEVCVALPPVSGTAW